MVGDDFDWAFARAIQRSDEILSMSDSWKGVLIDSFQGNGYLSVVLRRGSQKKKKKVL